MADLSLSLSLEEYMFTAGILIAFLGLIVSAFLSRRRISEALKDSGFGRKAAAMLVISVLAFIAIEALVVHPTQQIFFDDDIYLAMAQDLVHTGQAWMCNYGTPTYCYSGAILHEPIGESFNLAMGFLIFGTSRGVAYGTGVLLGALSVAFTFLDALMLFRERTAAFLSSALIMLAPVLLLWTMPTNSDLPTLTYSLIAIFFMLVFMRKKGLWTLGSAAMALALVTYMKVDAIAYVLIIPLMYLALDDDGILASIKGNADRIIKGLSDTRTLLVLLVFVIAIAPEMIFVQQELGGGYGYAGTTIQNTCNISQSASPSGTSNLQNLEFNICANVLFWFDQYGAVNGYPAYPIAQPIAFTLFAIMGVALMFAVRENRRTLMSIALWSAAFFIIYTSFYAGSVLYGVDWRFQLGLIAQASLLGGFGAAWLLLELPRSIGRKFGRPALYCMAILIIAAIAYSFYAELPAVGIMPMQISQAQPARFYENLVFNSSHMIPANSLVLSYDPTLFIINNKTSAQMGTIFDKTQFQQYSSQYEHLVLDWGYWCYTPNNYCTQVQKQFNLVPIYTQVDDLAQPAPQTFGFYLINGTK